MQSISFRWVSFFAVSTLAVAIQSCHESSVKPKAVAAVTPVADKAALWPIPKSPFKPDLAMEQRIDSLINKMTTEQKVGQLIQPEIHNITPQEITQYHIGSVLNGGGSYPNRQKNSSAQDWVALAKKMYEASLIPTENGVAVPLFWGTDAVHGHNNVIGATLFPHNIALGATHNPALMEKIGAATAEEIAATGIGWSFAPTVAVVRDDRWGRTYESYSENPELVKSYAGKMVEGLQGEANTPAFLNQHHVIATAKHFLGDGGTKGGIDRGDTQVSEAELVRIHAQGYVTAIEAGVQTIMASFNSWQGERMHGNAYLLTDVLKKHMGFDGLVVGDWNGHEFVSGCTQASCAQAINAGVDIVMVPDQWRELYKNTVEQVKSGTISQARLDDAVRRILRVKMRAGLFDRNPFAGNTLAGQQSLIGAPEHRAIAREAVRESVVLLKNNGQLLPLKAGSNILLTGDGADNIGKQAGGWSITWQGTGNANSEFPGATSIYKAFTNAAKENGSKVLLSQDGSYTKKPDVAIVVFGENPYAEMQGDINSLALNSPKELALMQRYKKAGIPVVSLMITGRPRWVNPQLNASTAFAVIWQPGTEAQGIADVLMRKKDNTIAYPISGKLSFSWPATPKQTPLNIDDADYQPLFPYGFGLTENDHTETGALPEDQGGSALAAGDVAIFKNRVQEPWHLELQADRQKAMPVNSSSMTAGALQYKTTDHLVQEDSLQLEWNGSAAASLNIISNERVDLSNLPKDAALSFDVKVQQAPTKTVNLAMSCGSDCGKSIAIEKQLTPGDWKTLSFSMSCFPADKVKRDMVLSPFQLATAGELRITIGNIRIESNKNSVQCP